MIIKKRLVAQNVDPQQMFGLVLGFGFINACHLPVHYPSNWPSEPIALDGIQELRNPTSSVDF